MRRRGFGIVEPDTCEDVVRIAGSLACAVTKDRAARYSLTVLCDTVQPGTAPYPTVEALKDARFAAWVIAVPLGAPEHEVDLWRRLHADAADSAVVGKVIRCICLLHETLRPCCLCGFYRRMNHCRPLTFLKVPQTSRVAIVVHRTRRP